MSEPPATENQHTTIDQKNTEDAKSKKADEEHEKHLRKMSAGSIVFASLPGAVSLLFPESLV